MSPKHDYFQLPIDMARFALQKKCYKGLALFLYLKFHSDGIVNANDPVWESAGEALEMTDPRSIEKYVNQLKRLNWIGFSTKSKKYFLRGFDEIRLQYEFKHRRAVMVEVTDLGNIQPFLAAVVIGSIVNGQKFFWERGWGKRLAAVNKKGVADQPGADPTASRPNYYGLSNATIARELGCRPTRACELKLEAQALGYLVCGQKTEELTRITIPDYTLRARYYKYCPEDRGKLIFKTRKIKGQYYYVLLRQLHSEILPLLTFKNIVRFNQLGKAAPTVSHIAGAISHVA